MQHWILRRKYNSLIESIYPHVIDEIIVTKGTLDFSAQVYLVDKTGNELHGCLALDNIIRYRDTYITMTETSKNNGS